jgi:hypothetical protein
MIVGLDGRIVAIGDGESINKQFGGAVFDYDIDATGKCIIPGRLLACFFSSSIPPSFLPSFLLYSTRN